MKVVIDTNVLVSAALKNRTPEEVLRYIVTQPGWEWVVSAEIIAEYHAVLARPKFASRQTFSVSGCTGSTP